MLRQSAELLSMDPDTVARSGALMIGSTDIKNLKDCIIVHVQPKRNESRAFWDLLLLL